MAKLRTLAEHNDMVHHGVDEWNKPRPNGIACPKCEKELLDTCPGIMLASNPPRKYVHCPACGYRGYRLT